MKNFPRILIALAAPLLLAMSSPEDTIRDALSVHFPELPVTSIKPTPIDSLYQVNAGPLVTYVSADGAYIVQGDIISFHSEGGPNNLTEKERNLARLEAINAIPDEDFIVFPAENEKYQVTIFTDVDCGYCRKLHHELEAYHQRGISIRYLSMPRSGPGSEGFWKAVSIWCSPDRAEALTLAKTGQTLSRMTCPNPVESHLALAMLLGISGTPTMIFEDGRMLPGYLPAEALEQALTGES